MFAVPPTETGTHPAQTGGSAHFLTTPDVKAFADAMAAKRIATSAIRDGGWGLALNFPMPSGATLGPYEPRHINAQ